MSRGIPIGGGWLLDPLTGVAHKDPTHGMHTPVRHRACGEVFDLTRAHVTGRYTDCSTFDCPGCHAKIDDRPGLHIERL